ncbi:MAG: single-stranded DNA-binding protein [Bdellovibrionales bacterium]|nr:single-stranded DNA-binding protein [Bdellovibrionales bacterium]
MGVNKAILVGNIGRDPEVRYTSDQRPIATLSLATGERRKDQSGNWVEHTEWHRVVAFGKLAEFCSSYLKKGASVFIEGKIRTNKWQDKDGKDRYTTEIVAASIQFVGNKRDAGGADFSTDMPGNAAAVMGSLKSADSLGGGDSMGQDIPFEDDDIPF